MKLSIYPLLLFGIVLNAGAQLLLKAGMDKIGHFNFTLSNLLPVGTQVAFNPHILMGLVFYGVSTVVWLLVLSRVDVSIAYPMISIGYIMNAIGAYYLFGEALSLTRITGILIILFGVYLIAQTG